MSIKNIFTKKLNIFDQTGISGLTKAIFCFTISSFYAILILGIKKQLCLAFKQKLTNIHSLIFVFIPFNPIQAGLFFVWAKELLDYLYSILAFRYPIVLIRCFKLNKIYIFCTSYVFIIAHFLGFVKLSDNAFKYPILTLA